jgi:hypothetical protein
MRLLSVLLIGTFFASTAVAQVERETLCRDLAQVAGQTVLKREAGTSLAATERQVMRTLNDKPAAYKTVAPSVVQWAYRVQSTDANEVANTFLGTCVKG